MHRARTARRYASAAALTAVLAVAALPHGAGARQEDEVRTEAEGVGGYANASEAAPISTLFFERVIPIPTDPGEPQFEMTESYTETSLSTGPDARALASSLWPGPAVGDGFGTICECPQNYPIKADARYPGKPHESTQETPNGAGMHALAAGLDVLARAESSQSQAPEAMTYGQAASRSTSTVEKQVAIAHADASVSDVSMLAGLITLDSARTVLTATSDMETAKTNGTTEVNGLVIAGTGYTVDQNGVRPVEDGEPGDGVFPIPTTIPAGDELRKALGIEVELVAHEETLNGPDGERVAGGLRITVDTSTMKEALEVLPIEDVVDQLPREFRAELASLLALAPTIVYVIGRAEVAAAARTPFIYVPPTFPSPTEPAPPTEPGPTEPTETIEPPPPTEPDVEPSSPPSTPDITPPDAPPPPGGDADPPRPGEAQPPPASEPPPSVAPPTTAPGAPPVVVLGEAAAPEGAGGLPPAAIVLALVSAALGGRALAGLTGAAMGGAGSPFCARGAAKSVPDLRAEAEGARP